MSIIKSNSFTTEVVSIIVEDGTSVHDTITEIVLLLKPTQGNAILASSLKYNGVSGIGSYVSGGVFTQDGANVKLTLSLVNFVMPSADVEIPVCINIAISEQEYRITGSFMSYLDNVEQTSTAGAYDKKGSAGSSTEVIRKVFTAKPGYYFSTEPTVASTVENISSYNVSIDKTVVEGKLMSKSFIIDYTFPNKDVFDDLFVFNAEAVTLPTVSTGVYIRGYQMDINTIPMTGVSRTLMIYGDPGAMYKVVITGNTTGEIYNGETLVAMPSKGSVPIYVEFPGVEADETYTVTITGDLDPLAFDTPNGVPSVFDILQLANVSLTYQLTTINADIIVEATADAVKLLKPLNDYGDSTIYLATLKATSSNTIEKISGTDITIADFTNQDPLSNGGLNFTITNLEVNGYGTNTLTIGISYTLGIVGTTSVISQLPLDLFVSTNTAPEAQDIVFKTLEDTSTLFNISSFASDFDGDTLTYTLLDIAPETFNIHGTISNFNSATGTFTFLPDLNWFSSPGQSVNFRYNVSDGSADVTKDILIIVDPVPESPKFDLVSSPIPIHQGSAGEVYTWNMVYSDPDHLNSELTLNFLDPITRAVIPLDNGMLKYTINANGADYVFSITLGDGTLANPTVLTGPVPPGTHELVIRLIDPDYNPGAPLSTDLDQVTIQVSAAYDILKNMEFVVSYNPGAPAGTDSSMKSKEVDPPPGTGIINVSAVLSSSGHTCSGADFSLLVKTINKTGNISVFNIGNVNLNNAGNNFLYRLLTASHWETILNKGATYIPIISRSSGSNTTIPLAEFGITNFSALDQGGIDIGTYNTSNYVVGTPIGANARGKYMTLDPAPAYVNAGYTASSTLISSMVASSSNGVFELYLAPNSWQSDGGSNIINDTHSDSAGLQVFMYDEATAKQKEILSNGQSFSVNSTSTIKINIFTGTVTVS